MENILEAYFNQNKVNAKFERQGDQFKVIISEREFWVKVRGITIKNFFIELNNIVRRV